MKKIWAKWRKCRWCAQMFEQKTLAWNAYCCEDCRHSAQKRQAREHMRRLRQLKRDTTSRNFTDLKTVVINGQPRVEAAIALERSHKK